ncbi:MAG TPA: DUF4202 family protein [Thermoanaerobaculia bacterium]|nr:DUF4202 family protein [Thermoanaerobaculia bacterium]
MIEEVAVFYQPEQWREAERGAWSACVAAEFPSVFVRFDSGAAAPPHVTASQWARADFDTWSFDCSVDALAREPFTLCIADDRGDRHFPLQVLNRCQRLVDRRNRHSQGQLFDRLLRHHRRLHDVAKPLVRADYNHALDVWQWVLRLAPDASLPLQIAALFHDVERLVSEADTRVEHLAPDYQQFKDAHAAKGAEMTRETLAAAGVGEPVGERAAEIVARHERRSDDAEVALLNDADALSFFSLNSSGYADYFGPEQTRRKVAYTWRRMRDGARAKLGQLRVRPDLGAMLEEMAVSG